MEKKTKNAGTHQQTDWVPSINEYELYDFLRLIKSGADFLDAAVGEDTDGHLEQAVRNYATLVNEKIDEICAIFGQPGSSLLKVAENMAHAATQYRNTRAEERSAD